MSHLQTNNLLNPHQYGFISNRSTRREIALAREEISKATEERHLINIILTDVKGAFDKVWTNGLIYHILNLNMTPKITTILCNFIQDRTAIIEWKGECSNTFELKAGFPQGAVLSPTLYNIYIALLPPPIYQECKDIIYADDITQNVISPYKNKRDIV